MRLPWTILVATLAQRASRLRQLLDVLLPQTELHGGRVRVVALVNRGERSLGVVRQTLVDGVETGYVSFVDDDDLVPAYFVDAVVGAIDAAPEPPDYVGWRMQCWVDGSPLKPTTHSLEYAGWFDDEHGYYRDVSHLNPVKVELARRADFRRGEPPEDVRWADQLRPHLRTQVFVDRVMYHYRSSPSDSTWRGVGVDPLIVDHLDVDHPHFTYHPESSL